MAKRENVGNVISFELPSGIPVEIQEIDAYAEKALTNREELASGRAMNKVMRSALVSYNGQPMPANEGEANAIVLDMRSGDRNYLLLRIRMQSYGDEMIFNYKCPECKRTSGYRINLRECLDDGTFKIYPYSEDAPVQVETRGGIAEIDYSTGRTELWLAQQDEIDTVKFALARCKTLNGKKPTYKDMEQLSVNDLKNIRLAAVDLKGGLDPTIELNCLKCGNYFNVPVHLIPDFFIPVTTKESIGL